MNVALSLYNLISVFSSLRDMEVGIEAQNYAFDIIKRKSPIVEATPSSQSVDSIDTIEFKKISFFYPTKPTTMILNGFSEKFEFGKSTAIVGPSGCGKSTIAKLILRCYDCADG